MNGVFVRTEKGEREITSRSHTLSHTAWLTLVMVDGRSSVSELLKLKPRLYEVEQSLKLLADGSFIRVADAQTVQEERTPPPTLEAEWSRREAEPEAEATHERVAKTRVKRRHKISFAWLKKLLKRTAVTALLLLLLAIAALFLFPLSVYVSQAERMLSQKLQQPVSITGMRFVLDPRPALVLRQLSIGPDLKIGSARIVPALTTLHRPVKTISSLELEASTLDAKQLAAFAPLLWQESDAIRVRSISFQDFKLNAGGVVFAPVNGTMRLDEQAIFQGANLSAAGLDVAVTPGQSDLNVKITGRSWQLPTGAPLSFDRLTASGKANADSIFLQQFDSALYGGVANGSVQITWKEGWELNASMAMKDLNTETLFPVFSRRFHLTGALDGNLRFDAKSSDLAALFSTPRADAGFKISKGVIQNIDVVEAIKNGKATRGGKTIFDELTGTAAFANGAYHFRQVKLTSGALGATGQFDVSASDQLSGRFNAEFKPLPARGNMAIQVTGTVADPVLKPQ